MDRVLHGSMRAELRLHVAVAEEAHLGIELPSVHAEKTTVEVERREEGHGLAEARLGAHAGWGGHEEAREGSHLGRYFRTACVEELGGEREVW